MGWRGGGAKEKDGPEGVLQAGGWGSEGYFFLGVKRPLPITYSVRVSVRYDI